MLLCPPEVRELMKRQNKRTTAVVNHEEAMERAVAELLLDARLALSTNEDGGDFERQMRGHRTGGRELRIARLADR